MGAVVAAGALAGSGFVVQSSFAAQQQADIALVASINQTSDVKHEQLDAYATISMAHASQAADAAVERANTAIAAAKGKADSTKVATAVQPFSQRAQLGVAAIYDTIERSDAAVGELNAAVAEFDRKEAERVAAERAAAEAAAKAAAEQAAAEAAAKQAAKSTANQSTANQSTATRPNAPSNPSANQQIARDMLASFGWGDDQFGCIVELWNHESGWNANAYNASSGAGGIPQALPASKMASAGADWATNPATQIRWGLGYVQGRYGSPCNAWNSFSANGWY
ncbi:lytic transglycosylase domain-containing protein [Agromyces sp. MMS17-SY077]|uniref:aggregation-promoting factor C-terminal-like domain-containing protein n=1 Tax=Agromyces seonyuensis TaxID=2662446 RepID=UPI0019240479